MTCRRDSSCPCWDDQPANCETHEPRSDPDAKRPFYLSAWQSEHKRWSDREDPYLSDVAPLLEYIGKRYGMTRDEILEGLKEPTDG